MDRGRKRGGLRAAASFLLVLGLAESCAVRPSAPAPAPVDRSSAEPGALISAPDRTRLEALAAARAAEPVDDGYRIGPDDLLDIRIPDLLDAQANSGGAHPTMTSGDTPSVAGTPAFQQGFRVNGHGEVTVPMLGAVTAQGFTPTELEAELTRRLVAAGILRNPQPTVMVAEFRSRVIAVTGAVERPGLYPLTRPGATLADLVWAAGGPGKDAGRVLEFVPAGEPGGAERKPIRLDLEALLRLRGQGAQLPDVPARMGDVLSLATAGSVLVDGWVDKPGSYPVTRGLTVSGALAAAGGHLFAADRRRAEVKRIIGPGEDRSFTVDLVAVAHGEIPDVPVIDGDVVRLPASTARVVPYGIWTVAREMVHVGGNVLLF